MTEPDLDPVAQAGLDTIRHILATTPRTRTQTTDPNPTRARAIERARTERTTKETP